MAARIPVRNLYLMFCYAWDMFREGEVLAAGAGEAATLPELVAHVMDLAIRQLVRRGLDQGYAERVDSLTALRGSIDVPGSLPLRARRSPALSCRFDERSPDVAHNRVVKAALRRLVATEGLPTPLAGRLKPLVRAFEGVADVPLRPAAFSGVQLYGHNAGYALVLRLCRLVMDCTMPEQDGSRSRFRDVANDEASMRAVFEAFVRNLLYREQQEFEVRRPNLYWDTGSAPASGRLPGMRVDMMLCSPGRRIIIDTKYTVASLQTHWDRETVRSGHLYQLFTYLRNAPAGRGILEGVLLYPADGETFEFRDTVQGHPIRVATVDLTRDWQGIRATILSLAAPLEAGP